MKNILLTVFITLVFVFSITAAVIDNNLSNVQVTKNLASMPLSFTQNNGQWDDKIMFRANAGGATMWFASDGAYYQFTRIIESEDVLSLQVLNGIKGRYNQPDSVETMMIKASFVGANQNPQMVGVDMLEYKCN